ncbi:SAC3/GANP family protein [Cladophialophora carrionii]|uniref:SAC3/GANP family protein n=1 Tax=Cladophialophora carrionii TaxID=86049 RepID=A0A1C1CRI6_9EURO|nr:SAC3/GANP family protein [Cladophialophora carrionii]
MSNTPPPPPQQVPRQKVVWSPDVRDYVNRSFAKAAEMRTVSKEQIEAKLKEIITDATQSGNLDRINWKELPLPQQMILEERNRALLAPITPPPFVSPVAVPAPTTSYHTQPDVQRKRKSTELSAEGDASAPPPPWKSNGQQAGSLADRVSFNPKEKRPKLDMSTSVSKAGASLESRRRRFEDMRGDSNSPRTQDSSRGASPEPKTMGPIVGRSQKLEKNYFRLTSAPNPDDVRPLEVLRKTLELLKKKWRSEANYVYICDQFKSLRQDLTVQHIKNEFTTSVYEYHARIALEKGDLGEYNQCQTQLRALYKQNLGGHPVEFKAYRILYFIHTCNRTDMNDVLSDLTPADKKEPAIKHALEVRSALALGNYHKFFKLYLTVPDMGAYLMDMFVERERLAALACLCRAYKPDVRLRFVTEELGFESDEEACQFIIDHAPDESSTLLEERDGDVRFLTGKAGSIFHIAKAKAFGHIDIKGQI